MADTLSVPSLVSRQNSSPPDCVWGDAVSPSGKNNGYLYYLTASHSEPNSQHKTLNRKTIIYGRSVTHDGITYTVNNNKHGLYSEILHKLIHELDAGLKLWNRVFAIRFDLHHKGVTTLNNKWLTKFFKNLRRRLERAYGISRLGYVWVREHERGKALHYHVVLYLDGNKIRHSSRVSKVISATWQVINPVNHVYHPEHQFYFVDNQDVKQALVYRVSYMAKVRGKGYRKPGTNDFHGSSLG